MHMEDKALWRELWSVISISFILVSSTGSFEVGYEAMGDVIVACMGVRSEGRLTSVSWRFESRRIHSFTGLLLVEDVWNEGRTVSVPWRDSDSKASASERSV